MELQCTRCGGAGVLHPDDEARRQRGWAIRESRQKADLSLREAARAAGVSIVTMSDWEHGRAEPPARLPWEAEA